MTFHFRAAHEHMLMTRIKVNMIMAVPADCIFYQEVKDDLFNGRLSFIEQLVSIKNKWIKNASNIKKISNNRHCLKLLSNLLVTDLPWFGSKFQISKDQRPFLTELEKIVSDEKIHALKIKDDLLTHINVKNMIIDPSEEGYLRMIDDFLINLSSLEDDIQESLRWEGISTYRGGLSGSDVIRCPGPEKTSKPSPVWPRIV